MSTRITDLPQAETLNGSEVMPLVQNGVTKKATLDFINLAAPAALILQQTQQVYQDTVDVKTATDAVLIETQSVLTAARTNLGLGTAATATVTTSATDTTEGRLLKVGDFGRGALFTTDTSAASVAGSGLYRPLRDNPPLPMRTCCT